MNLQDHRKESVLNTRINFAEHGIMTRKDWIKKQLAEGATVEQSTKNRIDFNRTKFNRMNNGEQAEYERKCAEKVVCYNLKPKTERGYFEITKIEFDYFNELQLVEDLNTQKHDLSERIEAGIATETEIMDAEQAEFDFMNKYFSA